MTTPRPELCQKILEGIHSEILEALLTDEKSRLDVCQYLKAWVQINKHIFGEIDWEKFQQMHA